MRRGMRLHPDDADDPRVFRAGSPSMEWTSMRHSAQRPQCGRGPCGSWWKRCRPRRRPTSATPDGGSTLWQPPQQCCHPPCPAPWRVGRCMVQPSVSAEHLTSSRWSQEPDRPGQQEQARSGTR